MRLLLPSIQDVADPARFPEFHLLPESLLRRALDVLIKSGKAQVFRGQGEDGDGVKFV